MQEYLSFLDDNLIIGGFKKLAHNVHGLAKN